MNTHKLTIKQLIEDNPSEIAKHLGIGYCGDMNPFDHDGYFYSTKDWTDHGYAECVKVSHCDGQVFVEAGTIKKPDNIEDCFQSSGWARYVGDPSRLVQGTDVIDITPEVEIECVEGHWGSETHEDFGGPYRHSFPEDVSERRFWKHAIGWISELA